MIITWEIVDGYMGKSRPQKTEVPDNILAACEDAQEREDVIEDYVQEDFNQKISWYLT